MGGDPRLSHIQQIGTSGRAASHVLAQSRNGVLPLYRFDWALGEHRVKDAIGIETWEFNANNAL